MYQLFIINFIFVNEIPKGRKFYFFFQIFSFNNIFLQQKPKPRKCTIHKTHPQNELLQFYD